jgi:hypothetical protein
VFLAASSRCVQYVSGRKYRHSWTWMTMYRHTPRSDPILNAYHLHETANVEVIWWPETQQDLRFFTTSSGIARSTQNIYSGIGDNHHRAIEQVDLEVALWVCIREVLDSNLSFYTSYPDRFLHGIPQSLQAYAITCTFQISSNSWVILPAAAIWSRYWKRH